MQILTSKNIRCGPCREIAPILADWERQMSDLDEEDIAFFKLDIEEVPSVARDLEITSMPTFMIYRNGKLMKTVVGAKVSSLRRAIDKAMRTWEAELEEEEESM